MQGMSALRLPLFVLGLVLIFASERYLYPYEYYRYCVALGSLLAALAMGWTVALYQRAETRTFTEEAKAWLLVMSWKILVIIGIVGYYFYQWQVHSLARGVLHLALPLVISWSTLGIGAFLGFGIELNLRNLGEGKYAEPRKLVYCARLWLSIGLLFLALVALNYSAAKKDQVYDLSYFKSTQPGAATLKLLDNLTAPIRIGLFFAKGSEVLPFVREYAEAMAKHSAHIQVEFFEKDFAPLQAEDFKVAHNGQISLAKDKRRQSIALGDKLEFARKKLQNLDLDMQNAISLLSSEPTPIYFSQQHGEMRWGEKQVPDSRSLQNLAAVLRAQNFTPILFNQSLTNIPSDAAAVAIIGPSTALDRSEIDSLRRYLAQGGKLLIALDIAALGESSNLSLFSEQLELDSLLTELGMHYRYDLLANDREFVHSTQQKFDHILLYTNIFANHDSVAALTKNNEKMNVLTMQSGYLIVENAINNWQPVATIMTLPSTFIDKNRNLEFDQGEMRGSFTLAAAAEKIQMGGKKSRVIILADANMLSDPPLAYSGNQQMALANFNWLADRSDGSAKIEPEEDVKIQHSQGREILVFHSSILIVPSLILAMGMVVNRRRRHKS